MCPEDATIVDPVAGKSEIRVGLNKPILLLLCLVIGFAGIVALPQFYIHDFQTGKLTAGMAAAWIAGIGTGTVCTVMLAWRKTWRGEPALAADADGITVNIYPLRPMRRLDWDSVSAIRTVGSGRPIAVVIKLSRERAKRPATWLRPYRSLVPAVFPRRHLIVINAVMLGGGVRNLVGTARRYLRGYKVSRHPQRTNPGSARPNETLPVSIGTRAD